MLEELGWKNEGVAFYSNEVITDSKADDRYVPFPQKEVYRLCNRNAKVGAHHYTTSSGERDLLISLGWRYEGIGFFGVDYDRIN